MTLSNSKEKLFTFHHAQLGSMTGVLSPDNVVQFKGVPFATIPGRFEQSILLDKLPESSRHFTRLSYAAPQIFPDDGAGGGSFPGVIGPPPTSEYDCLNLQINVPLSRLNSSALLADLPVLVYIHGGGFVLGKIDEEHDTSLLCAQSQADNQPTITVAIQYRLGALGYLHTPEEGHSNRGQNDQRNALLWIQKFVGGFGGDQKRVTVFGESAGAISICGHMLSRPPVDGPLFNRAILMSGVLGPMVVPVSKEDAEERYKEFLDVLSIDARREDAMEKLRELDVQKIVEATGVLNDRGKMWLTVRDGTFFREEVESMTWEQYPDTLSKCDWVDEIVLGTTSFEGTPQMSRLAGITPQKLLAGITDMMGEDSANVVSKAYNITPSMDQGLCTTQAMRWLGDVIFDAPTHALAQSLSATSDKKVYRYIFDVRNPFPNQPLYQQAHHWVDVYFIFMVHQFRYPSQRLKDISTKHAQLWLDFTNDKVPWEHYKYTGSGEETIMVADEREGWVERTVAENERIMEWSWKRCEQLWESWAQKRGKPFLPLKIAPLTMKKLT